MASQERDDAMAGLLKRTLAGDVGTGNDCPAPDILAAYFERSLDSDETARYELHFSQCPHCRDQLAALVRASEIPATPGEKPRAVPVAWLWDWRWLAPVAAVLVLAAVWATRRPALTRIAEQPTQLPLAATPQPPPQTMPQPMQQPARAPSPELTAPASSASPPAKPAAGNAANAQLKKAETSSPEETHALEPPAESVQNLPLSSRNFNQVDTLVKPAAGPGRTSESVTVESAAPTVAVPSARAMVRSAPPVSSGVAGGVGGGVLGGVGVASGSAGAVPKTAQAKQVELPAANQYGVQAQSVAAQTAEQVAVEPLIRTPDPKILWRIAEDGFVERSEDAGATWHGQLPNSNARLVAGSAPGPAICWFVGDDGAILLTVDAAHWQTIRPPVRADLAAVTALDASSAIVTAADGRKFATANRGKTWTPAP
ncbi:MAG: hypothetical protein ABSE45_11565 [Candidatus Acidiferrales bacterium]|jgi:hypothetical protein